MIEKVDQNQDQDQKLKVQTVENNQKQKQQQQRQQKQKLQQFQQFDDQTKKYIDNKLKNKNNQRTWIYLISSSINSLHLMYLIKQKIDRNKIQQLWLGQNNINDEGIKYFTHQSSKFNQLIQLSLYENNISMKGVLYLSKAAQMKYFPQLKMLSLGGNKIGSSCDKQLLKSEEEGLILRFANENTKLQTLFLRKNNINDNDMKILFKTYQKNKKIFHHLEELCLNENKIKDEGVKVFTQQSIQYPFLNRMYLDNNQINKQGIKYLVSYKNKDSFKNLKILILSKNEMIGDNGIYEFMKGCQLGAFPLLSKLSMNDINLSSIGFQHILKLYNPLKSLKLINWIRISNTNIPIDKKQIKLKIQKRFYQNVQTIQI